jgi:hypothetical protein
MWAHVGLGRVVHPVQVSEDAVQRSPGHLGLVEGLLADPTFRRVSFDISWDEVAKYGVASPETVARVATMLNRYPDGFLSGTDTVAPANAAAYYVVFDVWQPVWQQLTPDASLKVRKGHYERIFDEGRRRVRA